MKKAFVYGLLATLAITGCQAELEVLNSENNTEPEVITQEPSKVFTAVVDEDFNSETKTSLDGSGNVLWKMGDQVSIFAASTVNEQYQVSDDSDGKTAATLNKIPAGGFVAGGEIDNNVAFYPYASTAEIAKSGSNYVISEIELPATQTYAAGSFGNGAFPMATVTSSTEDMNLKFKNVLGGLKLQLKGTSTITSITVTGNNNEILCGDAEVTTTYGGVPSISLSDASAKTVTLDCGAGVTLDSETATPFIIALPPMTMTGGFTVEVTDSEGKQMEIKTTKPQTITRSNLLKMPVIAYEGTISDWSKEPLTITSTGKTSVSIVNNADCPYDIALEVRKCPGGSWAPYTVGNSISLKDEESLQFRAGTSGNNNFNNIDGWYGYVVSGSGSVKVSGNIMSLLDRTLSENSLPDYCFEWLFGECTKITDASNLILPATELSEECYKGMFNNCTSLTTAPTLLPATEIREAPDCYCYMFRGCTSLTTAPVLPATVIWRASGCYASMFEGCTSLTTAPNLPAEVTSEGDACYENMFKGCTSLTTAPALPMGWAPRGCYSSMFEGCTSLTMAPNLPATNLREYCYENMFKGCTSLTTAPALPATDLSYAGHCYQGMFEGCSNLTTAPDLPASTLGLDCYDSMFEGCTSLTMAPNLPATNLREYCYENMFKGCTSLTTAPALPATDLSYAGHCYQGMFEGCSNLTTAPDLPASTLGPYCYTRMFAGCSNLTTAPDLPASTLVPYCYSRMFVNCSKLNYIKMLATNISASNCLSGWVSGVAVAGTFVKNSSATWDVTGVNGVPSGWTVITE